MMRHFDMKRYPRKRGEDLYTNFGGAIIQWGAIMLRGGGYYSRKYGTICALPLKLD